MNCPGEGRRPDMRVWALALALLGMPRQSLASNEGSAPLSFQGARLGMSLAEWKSLPPPAGDSPSTRAVCSNDPAVAAALARWRGDRSDVVVCTYASVYGPDVLLQSAPVDQHYRAGRLLFEFRNGVLSEIRVAAPVDAFNDMMALLKGSFGPPSQTLRDQIEVHKLALPRVREAWRTAGGEVELTAPADTPSSLTVRYTGPETAVAGQAPSEPLSNG